MSDHVNEAGSPASASAPPSEPTPEISSTPPSAPLEPPSEPTSVPAFSTVSQKSASEETLVEVEAPSNLAEGFTFDAVYNGEVFRVEVPPGGVVAGQRLHVPFIAGKIEKKAPPQPMGKWKDGLCSCCRYGPCHPSMCCALWCQTCAMAQVMTRLKLNWLGDSARSEDQWRNTYRNVLWLTVIFYVADSLIGVFTGGTLHLAYVIYVVWVLMKTRAEVRRVHAIPEGCCGSCEDCCLAYWCTCCVTAQLARQTADYDSEEARCCTDNGLAVET